MSKLNKFYNDRPIRNTTEVNGYVKITFKDGAEPKSITIPIAEYKIGRRLDRVRSSGRR